MEHTDFHEIVNLLLSVVALILELVALSVSLAKRLWLGAAAFGLMVVTSLYWLIVLQLLVLMDVDVAFGVHSWAPLLVRMVHLAGWLLLVLQLIVLPRERAA